MDNWIVTLHQVETGDTAYRLAQADPGLASATQAGADGPVWVRIGISEVSPGQLSTEGPGKTLGWGNFELNAVYAGGRVVAALSQVVVGTDIVGVIRLPQGIEPSVVWVRIAEVSGNAPLAAWGVKEHATFMHVDQRPEPNQLGLDPNTPARVGETMVNEAWAIEVISVKRVTDSRDPTQDLVQLSLIARLIHPLAPLSVLNALNLSTDSPYLILPDPNHVERLDLFGHSSFLQPDYRVAPGGSQTGTIVCAIPADKAAGSLIVHFEPEDLVPPRHISLDP